MLYGLSLVASYVRLNTVSFCSLFLIKQGYLTEDRNISFYKTCDNIR